MTEEPKPVGSGRFREQTRDAEAVPGLSLSLLIQDLPPSVSLLCREHPLLQVSLLHFLGSRPAFSIACETGKVLDAQLSGHIADSSHGNGQRITQEQAEESHGGELESKSKAILSTRCSAITERSLSLT